MVTEDQLHQVWQNRQKRSRRKAPPEQAGAIARTLLDRKAWAETAWQRRLRDVLSEGEAEDILEMAVPLGVRDGVLELGVENPAAAYHLRMTASTRIVELFQTRLPQAGIHAVRFIPYALS